MGLDMYLFADKYVSNHGFINEEEKDKYKAIVNTVGLTGFTATDAPHVVVQTCVGYWRKANAIHNWFVQNVQGGVDDCRKAYVEKEQLQALKTLCFEVFELYFKRDYAAIRKLLPPTSGFFFGTTDIDSYFIDDINKTISILDRVLQIPGVYDFYYQSSW